MVPQKASGGGGRRGGGGGGVVYHTSTGQYIGVATFFFFFFVSGLKLDEKSIENGLEAKVRNFWLCAFSGVVATTLVMSNEGARLFFLTIIFSPDFESRSSTDFDRNKFSAENCEIFKEMRR